MSEVAIRFCVVVIQVCVAAAFVLFVFVSIVDGAHSQDRFDQERQSVVPSMTGE